MSYTFSFIENNVQELYRMIKNKFTSCSFIISGSKGIGKDIIARRLAHIFIEDDKNYNSDVFFLDSSINKISIQDTKNIEIFASKTSLGKYKIIIISKVDSLSNVTSNALLKLLEEIPKNCYCFLISDNIASVSKTIRSRCINIRIKPKSYSSSYQDLKKEFPEVQDNDIAFSLSITNNSPTLSKKLIECNASNLYSKIISTLSLINNQNFSSEFIIDPDLEKNWDIFKVTLPKFLKKLIYSYYNQNIEYCDYEKELILQLSKKLNFNDRLDQFYEINRLIYHADYSNLSKYNTLILILYKIAL